MTSYADYLGSTFGRGNPLSAWMNGINALYNQAHGGLRYTLSKLPVFGDARRFVDESHKWEDTYNNTGRDPVYSGSYGSGGMPFVNELTNLAKPARMARSLAKMYGVEVELNIAKERTATARAYRDSARAWKEAWEERNRKR